MRPYGSTATFEARAVTEVPSAARDGGTESLHRQFFRELSQMKRAIELKHVGPKGHVRTLIEELIGHLEYRVAGLSSDAASLHVLFEENRAHRLYRIALACHVPGRTVAAHEEGHVPGAVIREAFAELTRQLQKATAMQRRARPRRRAGVEPVPEEPV